MAEPQKQAGKKRNSPYYDGERMWREFTGVLECHGLDGSVLVVPGGKGYYGVVITLPSSNDKREASEAWVQINASLANGKWYTRRDQGGRMDSTGDQSWYIVRHYSGKPWLWPDSSYRYAKKAG